MPGVTRAPRHVLMTADAVGGVWTYALDVARGLAARGDRVTLAVLGPPPDTLQRDAATAIPGVSLEVTGLPLDWMATTEEELRDAASVLAARAAALAVDIVQLNTPALAVARFPVPVLGVCHSCLSTWWHAVRGGAMPADFAWRSALQSAGYAGMQALAAPSHAFAVATQAAHGLPGLPHVVPNGRDAPRRTRAMEDFVLTAGRLWDAGKDVATLDRAAGRLRVPVVAAGPLRGPHGEAASLPHLVTPGSLAPRALRALMLRGPVFASSARYEPFGLAVLEAAQAGCALVLSDIPTFREIWDGAATFVPVGDSAGFAAAIEALLRDPERRAAAGVAAWQRGRTFDVDGMVGGLDRLLAVMLAPKATPREAA